MTHLNILLFDQFETIDAFGPAQIMGRLPEHYKVNCFSMQGGPVTSWHGVQVNTMPASEIDKNGILLIPGTSEMPLYLENQSFLTQLKDLAEAAPHVLTVCTGSFLLALTSLLNGRSATTNKMAIEFAAKACPDTQWIRKARWVVDGKYYTSSGVSAGMDMAMGFIHDINGPELAEQAAIESEYIWNKDKSFDPFARS
ncbi:MAG: DJ-1/PfpI family protein [Lacrimispora sp.]|uniref:DJ-1/PfpI family protein n=1 Tax=Lacrimispora sp. TaxID=2719234 RepID=UPI0039E310F5